jgi:hypothetical protein
VTVHDVADVDARVAQIERSIGNVRDMGSILILRTRSSSVSTGSAFEDVKQAGTRAGVPCDRINELH